MGLRQIADNVGCDRKTVRRYVDAAVDAGLVRDGGQAQLTDALIGAVVEAVRPERPGGHGTAWEACAAEHDRIKAWLDKDLKLTKVHVLLGRHGVLVPYRTLHRFAAEELMRWCTWLVDVRVLGREGSAATAVERWCGHFW
jgi:DNA-binding transcriptional regulator LsrR (DeoR family)